MIEKWCQQDHGGAISSLEDDGQTCKLSWLVSDEYVTQTENYIEASLLMESSGHVDFTIDRDHVVETSAIGGDLEIQTTDGTIRIKRDRRGMFTE